ncbi:hypothetical protein OZX62_07490 [Bifidobacterium sp. ESL0690]|uniref:hypothetical protein n=1 Tax=Bifidobacterium sp. ESL0690 TaxID=2983214 RepID=UPI0023F9E488|nr:hypothetical protein [Bifidobacterium sp. ESL0690]WEV46281.1 hypothetical protein OZX62_07490 [Bifidobacterium sp. ESL0690]
MLNVNTDDVLDAKNAMDSLHDTIASVAQKYNTVDVSSLNAGMASSSADVMARGWFTSADALAIGLKQYSVNLSLAHLDLTTDISFKRAAVAGLLGGGSVANPVNIFYDDEAKVDQTSTSLDRAFASFILAVEAAKGFALMLDNGGGEKENILAALFLLSGRLVEEQIQVNSAKEAWDNYGQAVQDFDDKYKEEFSHSIVGNIPNLTKTLPSQIKDKVSKFLSDFVEYTKDPSKIKDLRNPEKMLENFKDEFKDFLPYETYFKKYDVGVKGHESGGRKICNDFDEIVKDLDHGDEFGALGKGMKFANKGLGVAGKAMDLYDVASKGVGAFLGTNGSIGDRLGAGFKASGKEGVKVGVSTAITAVATIGVGVALGGLTGPFAPLVVAGVQVGASVLISGKADEFGGKVSERLFGR